MLALWLPIVLAAAAVWFFSTIASAALPHHRGDFRAIPSECGGEEGLMDDLRRRGIPPGNYIFPDFRSRAAMDSPRIQKVLNEGPVGHLHIWRTPLTMADKMVGTLFVQLVVSGLIAYLTRVAIPGPAPFGAVFRVAATAGVLAHCFAFIPAGLWWGSYKRMLAANILDGLINAAITGALFAWLWPR